jgi:chemotaxis protein MotB
MRRKRQSQEQKSGNGFIVLYVSLSIILLSFFVVINSIATIDSSKLREALGSLIGSFGVMPGGVRPDKGEELLLKAPPIVRNSIMSKSGKKVLENLAEYLENLELQDDVTILVEKTTVTIAIADNVLFAPGESAISPPAYPILDRIVKLIRYTNNNVVVEGHTDATSIYGPKFASNWELSGSRAVNVVEYLLKDGSISMERLAAAGYGQFKPLVANNTSRGRARNRRVSIVFKGEMNRRKAHRWRDYMIFKGFIFKLKSAFGRPAA